MADLNPEVTNALVRLVRGETNYAELSDDELFALAAGLRRGRQTLREITLTLRERGLTFAQIGERLGVTESAAYRWSQPSDPPGPPRRKAPSDRETDQGRPNPGSSRG